MCFFPVALCRSDISQGMYADYCNAENDFAGLEFSIKGIGSELNAHGQVSVDGAKQYQSSMVAGMPMSRRVPAMVSRMVMPSSVTCRVVAV